MKRFIAMFGALVLSAAAAKAETIRLLMETVPDTRYIQELLPEFEKETGIKVEIEAISYIDMHSKLIPQLIAPRGSYDAIVVDFYWVGEFTKAGWLMPLDDLVAKDGIDTGVYVPKLMDLVGRVDGTLYMLPFYNYSMAVIYRKDLLEDPAEQAEFKAKHGMDLRVPATWDEYWKQVEFFTRDSDGMVVVHGEFKNHSAFNVPALPGKPVATGKLHRTGLMHVHTRTGGAPAEAWSYVADHPYFAWSDEDGSFDLKDVPAGDVTLEVYAVVEDGLRSASVVVKTGDRAEVRLDDSSSGVRAGDEEASPAGTP